MSSYLPQFTLEQLRAQVEKTKKNISDEQIYRALAYSLIQQIKAERLGLNPDNESMLKRILTSYGFETDRIMDIIYSKNISPDVLMRWEQLGINPEGEGELDAYLKQMGLMPLKEKLELLKDNEESIIKPKTKTPRLDID